MGRIRVQEVVNVVVFRGVGEVCKAAVGAEKDDEPEEVDPGTGVDSAEYELEEPEDGVHGVLGDVGP